MKSETWKARRIYLCLSLSFQMRSNDAFAKSHVNAVGAWGVGNHFRRYRDEDQSPTTIKARESLKFNAAFTAHSELVRKMWSLPRSSIRNNNDNAIRFLSDIF